MDQSQQTPAPRPLLSGFTFVKNALSLGFPIKECILSLLPLCDEVIVNVGFDDPALTLDDGTFEHLQQFFTPGPSTLEAYGKIKWVKNYWDPQLRQGGLILSQQTNLALAHCQGEFAQYLQADEVLHEEDYGQIRQQVELMQKKFPEVDGVIFEYVHFYGNFDIIKRTRKTYRREIRLIRNFRQIQSWKDAQGFRHLNEKKLLCLLSTAKIYHYGWARPEATMRKKVVAMDSLYNGGKMDKESFRYDRIWGLEKFAGNHPQVMKEWIEANHRYLDCMDQSYILKWRDLGSIFSDWFERKTGIRIGEYKNYLL